MLHCAVPHGNGTAHGTPVKTPGIALPHPHQGAALGQDCPKRNKTGRAPRLVLLRMGCKRHRSHQCKSLMSHHPLPPLFWIKWAKWADNGVPMGREGKFMLSTEFGSARVYKPEAAQGCSPGVSL